MTESQDRATEPNAPRSTLSMAIPPLVATLVFAGVLLALHATGVLGFLYDKEALGSWVEGTGPWAPLAFLALLAVRPFTLFPSVWLAPVAFALFGWGWGATLKIVGETIGATLAFLTARHGFSRAFGGVLRKIAPRLGRSMDEGFVHRLGKVIERRSTRAVLALRFNLLLPFDGLNYGLGLTTLRVLPYVVGTSVGIIPGTFLYVGLAGGALEMDWLKIALMVAGILAMIALSIPFARDLSKPPSPAAHDSDSG